MILSMTCRRNLFPVFFLLVAGGYFLYRSFPEAQEYNNILVPDVEEFEVVEPVHKETIVVEPVQEESTVIEPVQEEKTVIEPAQEETTAREPVQEDTTVVESSKVVSDDEGSVGKSSMIMEPVEEPRTNVESVNNHSDIEELEDTPNKNIDTPETNEKQKASGASVLNELKLPGDFQDIDPECVDTPAFYGGVKAKLCILPGERFIETHLKSDGAFEMETINAIVKAMSVYKDATFLDCGSNIGMMSTVVAAMGRKVVSVDPLVQHLSYLRRSLELLGNQNNARLLNNAVSNETGRLYPYTKKSFNQAAIKMYTEEEIKKNNFIPTGPAVNVATVMNILATIDTPTVVMKVDVESFECRAVSTDVAHGKSGHFIPFIIMEWTMLQVMPEYTECVEWLYDGGYKPHHWVTFKEFTKKELLTLNPFWKKENKVHDVIWLHSKANPKQLKP